MFIAESRLADHCRPFERPWRNFCVDSGLRDDWLERLNSLSVFDLISICEGHSDEDPGEMRRIPHIHLRLKDAETANVTARWHELRLDAASLVATFLCDRNDAAHFEIRSGYAVSRGELEPVEIVLLQLAAKWDHLAAEPVNARIWFERNVAAVENFDRAFRLVLEGRPAVGGKI